jgi:hypothetical protein
VVIALPFMAYPFLQTTSAAAAPAWRLAALLFPQALVIALPAALLVAIPLAVARAVPSLRLLRRMVILCVLYAVLAFALIGWVMPISNQAFRIATSGLTNPPRGLNETSFARLRSQIAFQRGFPGSATIVRRLEYAYELRFALPAAAIPVGLFGLACGFSPIGRRRPLALGAAALAFYVLAIFPSYGFAEYEARNSAIPAGTFAWVPNAVIVFAAGLVHAGWPAAKRRSLP